MRAAARILRDDATVPVLAKGRTISGWLWAYVRDDRPFSGPDPLSAEVCVQPFCCGGHYGTGDQGDDIAAEFETPERCFIIELSNTSDDPEVSIARARVAPGVTTRWHRVIGTTERYVVMEGTGRVEVGDLPPQKVGTGDVVLIPPSFRQRITNTGARDLIFLAICSPRFRQDAYEGIDDEPLDYEGPR